MHEPAATAFHFIDPSTGSTTPCTSPSQAPVRTDEQQTQLHLLVRRHAEVARNGSVARIGVPKFAEPTAEFPHGFEVKLDGTEAGRLLLVRLVLSVRSGNEVSNSADVERVVSVRDV
jgi:hypothetical protein